MKNVTITLPESLAREARVQAAKQDAAPTVRAAAVFTLSRMNIRSDTVLTTFDVLRNDADPRVRQEVHEACVRMGLGRR